MTLNPDQAEQRLREGNARYQNGDVERPHQDKARRDALNEGQNPFAIVLGCADSRVPPALVFDQGLGDLFTVRVAGHVVDDVVLESVMYAVENLGTPLIVVLGHTSCGAVAATVSQVESGGAVEGALLSAIAPAVEAVRGEPGDLLNNAVKRNVHNTVEQLTQHPSVASRLEEGSLNVVGAVYDLTTGEVVFNN